MTSLCCPMENPVEQEARLSTSRLKATPVNIWWHRRRVADAPTSQVGERDGRATRCLTEASRFPSSWSINYVESGELPPDHIDLLGALSSSGGSDETESCRTEESSVFSTASQERWSRRDARGYCLRHPTVQLVRRRGQKQKARGRNHHGIGRLTRMFSKQHARGSSSAGEGGQDEGWFREEEWIVVNAKCPECEKEHAQRRKAQYQLKPREAARRRPSDDDVVTHVPFPATLTVIDSHPSLGEGVSAIRIRTDPIPTEQTLNLSFAGAARADGEPPWRWKTPDGAFDFLLPVDSDGKALSPPDDSSGGQGGRPRSKYQIMERIIPLYSIDHVSRGGDAWDVLRQSTGEGDVGCSCDIKIHGFSDRLLRFDVVNFGDGRCDGGCGFGNGVAEDGDVNYTTESVISKLNAIVAWNRVVRKKSVVSWLDNLTNFWYDCMSLGVHNVDEDHPSE